MWEIDLMEGSMKLTKLFVGAFALSAMLVACGDDSASAKDTEIEELSSSSVMEIASSSSTIRNDNFSSSSAMESSSSSETTKSSTSAGSIYDATAKTLTDLRDGQTYKTVTIGNQTWMAENLNYAYTGVPYEYIKESEVYASDSMSWCYDNDPANCAKYGRLYTWAAAMDSVGTWSTNGKGCGYMVECSPTYPVQGICPEGWHLPDTTEWKTLFTAVGGQDDAGVKLKAQTGWYDSGNGTDSFGFSALPAGYRGLNGIYYYEGSNAYFWSSSEDGSDYAYNMLLDYYGDYVRLLNTSKSLGFSVRCVKD